MPSLLSKFDSAIKGFNERFERKSEIATFVNALNRLRALAEIDLQQSYFFSLARTKMNWAPSLVERLTVILQETTSEEALRKNLPKLTTLCHQYEQKADISYPWARALGLLACSAVGLLLGLPIGAVVGFIGIFVCVGIATGPFSPWALDLSGTIAGVIAVVGLTIGAGAGAAMGTTAGYSLGSYLVGADVSDLSNAIFFHNEHLTLSHCAAEIEQSAKGLSY
ncbi:hypothetical protein BN59_03156 [Legionella massiliensis]|uniref:Uncharacterized protein n=1 Tax=Legionella massiliensis TaxID=1034943 RepID=A0A078L0S0_9GAMM|nr:hypothetical protein [Legionella massiliensis]CDZ78842.1 hypothetical protein BN59_03156 [Legionella massiliensis]CEE14580.1 hypothetical protein BN1094_03156 [Legionella massiliensis]